MVEACVVNDLAAFLYHGEFIRESQKVSTKNSE